MNSMVSYCGLSCDTCTIYLATIEKDNIRKRILRESAARQCNDLYGMTLQTEDISDCDGCMADTGRLFSGCLHCEIRKCAMAKHIDSCAFCEDYTCDKLEKHFKLDAQSKIRLEEIRTNNFN